MHTILRLLGHGAGLSGVLIGMGSIIRGIPLTLLRFIPYTHGITTLAIGGPLSLALVGIAALILGGGDGGS